MTRAPMTSDPTAPAAEPTAAATGTLPDRGAAWPVPEPGPVIAEVVRSGFIESWHTGSVIVLDAEGEPTFTLGQPEHPIFPRSALKPLLATAMTELGLDLPPDLLALGAASHDSEKIHLDGVRRILAMHGLDETALQTPPDWPLDEQERVAHIRAGGEKTSLIMNCSGKHSAMLATCVVNGWDTATYRAIDHPLQVAIRERVGRWVGHDIQHVGVDGCGAPVLAFPLSGLAHGFRRMALAEPGSPGRRVADAIAAFPEMTSGTRRDESKLIRAVPGLFGKSGAESVHVVAFFDGRAFALKSDDGSPRARFPVVGAALRRCGLEHPILDEVYIFKITGGPDQVGSIVPTF
jgi:L-asparaginase II